MSDTQHPLVALSVGFKQGSPQITCQPLPGCTTGEGCVLYGVLTPEECKQLIDQGEQQGLQQLDYQAEYRNCERVGMGTLQLLFG